MPLINAAGLAIIKNCEGDVLKAYPDPLSGGDPWTIGYGHTGPDVHPGLVITEAQADALLEQDLVRFEKAVNDSISRPLTSNQFSALVSFTYNVGVSAEQHSTLLRLVNAGDFEDAAKQFGLWDNRGSNVQAGLDKRRALEAALFLKK